ncbi:hypothetical protein Rh054_04365 [Rickettsia conorii subsp. heilongjiangensis 054]|nr:hypothetical protein Rh054_04365 [Rickettsia conorii subsp. heilongjiangensis 054]
MSSLTLAIFSILKEVLNDSGNEVKIVVIWSLTETVRINPSLAQETLKILNTLLNNPSNYIEFTIAKILGWIIQINPNISHDASKILKNLSNIKELGNVVKEFGLSSKAIERHDQDNIAVQLALKDSILFIESLYTNRDDIMLNIAEYHRKY